MAQDLAQLNAEFWSNELQRTLFVENTAVFLAGREAERVLAQDGRKFHKPILSKPSVGTYIPGSDISDTDLNSTDATLEVDTFKYASVYLDDTEKKQNSYETGSYVAESMMRQLNNEIEQAFLSEVTNATHTVDNASIGGAAGNIDMTETNVYDVFDSATNKLNAIDAPKAGRVAVLGTNGISKLRRSKSQRESGLGDMVLDNGVVGMWNGWTVVENNNLPWSASLKVATNPSENDYVIIAGVTFTFKGTVGSTAGNVHIGDDAAESRANLKKAVEGGAGAGTDYVALGDEDRFLLTEKRGVTCTSAQDMAFAGYGDISVSEVLTAAADVWSAQLQNAWFGVRGATDLAVQMPSQIEITRVEKRFGDRIKALLGYGKKTFADGGRVLCNVKLDATNF